MPRFQRLTPAPLRSGIGPVIFMAVVFAVMIVAIIGLDHESKVPQVVAVEEHPIAEIVTEVTPWDPELETWGPIHDETLDGQKDVPLEAFKIAATRVALRSWERFKVSPSTVAPDHVGFRKFDVREALAAPAKLRGAPVELLGTLVSLDAVDVFDAYGDFKFPDGDVEAWEGLVRVREDRHGSAALVKFTLTEDLPYPPESLLGRPVKVQGIFFKLHRLSDGGELETGAWVIAKAIHSSFEIPSGDEIRLTLLDDVADAVVAEDVDDDFFGEDAFFHLMGHVLENGDELMAAPSRELRGRQVQELLRNPDEYRGEIVEFQARVLKIDHFSMEVFFKQNARGDNAVDEFWNTYVTVDGTVPLTVMWLKDPNIAGLQKRDQVRIRGVFYRNWGYRAGRSAFDKKRVKAPLIIGIGEIVRADVAAGDGLDPLSLGIGAFIVLVLGILAVVLRADRRRAQLFAETRRAKRQITRGGLDLNDVADKTIESDTVSSDA